MVRKLSNIAIEDTQGAPSHAAASPAPGHIIGGKYRIEGLIGKGGMGVVYHSTHLVSGKRVAVKWMLPVATATAELAERFLREARATARIEHPNVVDIYDVGTQDGSVYLVMELLHGESLADRLDRGPMDATEAAALLMHALRAVAAAHAQGVIHRDLKPDNIFLCVGQDGELREPKVVDFGISKINADQRDMSLTQSGIVMGTPYYMSPEQVRGLRDVDERGDVYAFGVILYEMLTGECPFDAETYNQLILKIVTEEPTPLASLRPDVDPNLIAVITRAMARNRDDRYPSVSALAADLEPFAGGVTFRRNSSLPSVTPMVSRAAPRGSHARTPLTAERTAPRPRRSGRQVAMLALLALAAIGAGMWWGYSSHAPRAAVRAGTLASPSEFVARPVPPAAVKPVAAAEPAATDTAIDAPPGAALPAEPAAANTAPTQATARPASHTAHKHTPEAPEAPAPAATTKQGLPADWNERLPTNAPQAPGRASSAGKLGRDDCSASTQ